MSDTLFNTAEHFPDLPIKPEESWKRISPELFFIDKNDALNIAGKSVINTLSTDKPCWQIQTQIIDASKLTELLRDYKVPEQEYKFAAIIKIDNNQVSAYLTKSITNYITLSNTSKNIEALMPDSEISTALAVRLKTLIGNNLEINMAKIEAEEPSLVIIANVNAALASQQYSAINMNIAEYSKVNLAVINNPQTNFSMQRLNLNIKEHAVVSQAWIITSDLSNNSETKSLHERKVLLAQGAQFYDAHLFAPHGITKIISVINLTEPLANSVSSSAIWARGNARIDFEPIQAHYGAKSKSSLKTKVLIDNNAKAAFQGLIDVQYNAPACVALQDNKNLMLSRTARIEASPRLHIFPDDVVCKHGSATGEIDLKHVYYLQTRGFTEQEARALIINGFIADGLSVLPENNPLSQMCLNWLKTTLAN